VTALVLGALLAYRRARLRGSIGWLLCSLACAGLALFTHEYAVTLGVLIAGLEVWLYRQGQLRSLRPYALLYLAQAAAFAVWWLAVPKWPRAFQVDAVSVGRNALMFLQALFWPLGIAWRRAPPALLAHPELAIAAGAAAALPLVGWLFWRGRALGVPLLALGWLAVTALPVWATLHYEYLEDGARLYYLPGVGIALGWAALTQLLAPRGWSRRCGLALLVAVYGWATWQSVEFLALRRAMYAEGSELLRQAAAAATAAPAGARVVFINVPAWKAPVEAAFPLGNTGVTFVPEYVLLGQALYVNGGGPAQLESLATGELPGGWPAHYGPHGPWTSLAALEAASRDASAVYLTRFEPTGLVLERLAAPP
jgi:hypothetical protein